MNTALEVYWTISNGLPWAIKDIRKKKKEERDYKISQTAKDRNIDPRSSANPKQDKC